MSTGDEFTPDVVAAVMRHMNNDHPADSLLICQGLGGQPNAQSALMSGMDNDGIEFVAMVESEPIPIRLAWSEHITDRPQIRAEVTRMYHEARAALGLAPVAGEEP